MSTPANRRRINRRHSRRLSENRHLLRRPLSTARTSPNIVDLDTEHNGSCIDLTTEEDVIDLTSVNDSPVVVLTSLDAGVPPHRRRTGRRTPRGRRGAARFRNQRIVVHHGNDEDSDSSTELPPFEITGTPSPRDTAHGEGTSTDMLSPPPVKITCPICMDDDKMIRRSGRQITSTTCGHLFCNQCIWQAIHSQHCCPTCRKKLTQRQTHPLFL